VQYCDTSGSGLPISLGGLGTRSTYGVLLGNCSRRREPQSMALPASRDRNQARLECYEAV
jgi:hypothetical protein